MKCELIRTRSHLWPFSTPTPNHNLTKNSFLLISFSWDNRHEMIRSERFLCSQGWWSWRNETDHLTMEHYTVHNVGMTDTVLGGKLGGKGMQGTW